MDLYSDLPPLNASEESSKLEIIPIKLPLPNPIIESQESIINSNDNSINTSSSIQDISIDIPINLKPRIIKKKTVFTPVQVKKPIVSSISNQPKKIVNDALTSIIPQLFLDQYDPRYPNDYDKLKKRELELIKKREFESIQLEKSKKLKMKSDNQLKNQIGIMNNPTSVLLLLNMITKDQIDDYIQQETAEECSKFGLIEKCLIHEMKHDQSIRIFIKYENVSSAKNGMNGLNGRFFGGRIVTAKYYNQETFDQRNYNAT